MTRVFLGLGSNEGDRLANLSRAIQRLGASPRFQARQMATIVETAPAGGPPQDPYFNTVIEAETDYSPAELLEVVKQIERDLGRLAGGERWGPRPIDLDILFFGSRVIRQPRLVIPHERLHLRRFVLEPLAQLAPDLVHPVLGESIATLLDRLRESPSPQSSLTCA